MFNATPRFLFLCLNLSLLASVLAISMPAHAQYNEGVLWSFGAGSDGQEPNAGLVSDSHGNLYGTTFYGGANQYGSVFELSPPSGGTGPWTETVLWNFCSQTNCSDGRWPNGSLIFDSHGNLYGTTSWGGNTSCTAGEGCGTVFELSPPSGGTGPWTETVLWDFVDSYNDGQQPLAGVIIDYYGNLYGTTESGGSINGGIAFRLSPPSGGTGPWTQAILYNFCQQNECADGYEPRTGLIFDSKGNLYGTTYPGGANPCAGQGCGTVFELSPPSGGTGPWTETVLWNFNGSDGQYPSTGLTFDSQGNLYGTTYEGGANSEGAAFELSPPSGGTGPWTENVLWSFGSSSGDGQTPSAALVFDSQGNLYGTTAVGGANTSICAGDPSGGVPAGCGTVFELSPPSGGSGPWTENILWNFGFGGDGKIPIGGGALIFDSEGNLYGTTWEGGTNTSACPGYVTLGEYAGCGVVFKLNPCTTPTTTGLVSSLNPSTAGQTVGFTATVSPAPTYALGLGSVTWKANGVTIGSHGLLTAYDGVVTLNDSSLTPSGSPYSVVATYTPPGGSLSCASSSAPVSQTVNAITTTTTLSPSVPTPAYGQSVALTATVSSSNGGTPTGTVAFKNGSALLGNGTLSAAGAGQATASLSTAALPVAANSITARYTGSSIMQASTSMAATVTVSQATSTTALAGFYSPSVYGETVNFVATVTPEYGGTPTGTMTFYENGHSIGVLPLSGGKATLPVTSLTPATYSLTATYNGSTDVAGSSTTTAWSQVVNKAATTTAAVSSSPTVTHGTPVTFTATVTATAPSTAVPPGSVVFYDTFNSVQTEIGVGTLSGGKATLTHTYTAPQEGLHSVTATYTGSAYVNASPASPAITQTVD